MARTVVNLGNHLASSHDVELVSLFRSRRTPRFRLNPRLGLTVLNPAPPHPSRLRTELSSSVSSLHPAPDEPRMNRLTDLLLRRHLASVENGVVLSTRPSLHLAALQLLPPDVPVVGQDHGHFEGRFAPARSTAVLDWAIPRLDAFAVLTAADADDYRARFPEAAPRIRHLPNALPWAIPDTPAQLQAKVVVTAGRLDSNKGHDRLVRAFAPVAAAHPDWRLHIYGAGPEDQAIEAQVAALGLEEQVELKGYTLDLSAVLAEASVYALTSRSESFSMSLIEAMSVGLPAVAMDCPRGPREIVEDHVNGILVPDGDEPAFTDALLRLVEDEDLRRSLGGQAHHDARRWSMDEVGAAWERLLEDVASEARVRRTSTRRTPPVKPHV